VVIIRGQRVVLRECGPDERWAGLWDFPRFPIGQQPLQRATAELANQVHNQTGLKVKIQDRLTTMKHGVTKYRITLHCLSATPTAGQRVRKPAKWVPFRELDAYPLSVTGRKICELAF
jgi:A/G-specific adenine glycosylase